MNSIPRGKIPRAGLIWRPESRGDTAIPLTIPAHQAPVLPLKLWRPDWFDATALCVGSVVPDLLYPFVGLWSHTFTALVVVVPVSMLIATLLRRSAGASVFPQFPDLGAMRLHSYAVIGRRRPLAVVTAGSAVIGALSHIVIDAFTHDPGWGARWLHLDEHWVAMPFRSDVSAARALQYVGHSVASVVGLLLFYYIGRHRLLERWYGSEDVRRARAARPTTVQRVRFWGVSFAVAMVVGGVVGPLAHTRVVFTVMAGWVVGLLTAGSLTTLVPTAMASVRPDDGLVEAEAANPRED